MKKKMKNSLKEAIQKLFEEDKEFMEEVKSVIMDGEPDVAPATKPATEPTTTPKTPNTPVKDPRKVPNPGIETTPKAKARSMEESISYKGKTITKLHPSGYFEFYSDAEGRFIKSDKLELVKRRIDSESKKKI